MIKTILVLLIMCAFCGEEIEGTYYEVGLYKKKDRLVEECLGERMVHANCLEGAEEVDPYMLRELFDVQVFYSGGE